MTAARSELIEYRLVPSEAPRNARRDWTERKGLLLRLSTSDGRVGQGEAAPLPGFSSETLDECRDALRALSPAWLDELSCRDSREAFARITQRFGPRLPAARAALESALLDVLGQAEGRPAWALLRDAIGGESPVPAELPVAALISGDVSDWSARAHGAFARGVRTLKVKIGRPGMFAQELSTLCELRAKLGPGLELRLDANRSFEPDEAETKLDALRAVAPEYVEEPTSDWCGLSRSSVPLALDESLADPSVLAHCIERRRELQLAAFVLKPTLLGVARTLELTQSARSLGLRAVLSHTFEGPVGFCLAAALAFGVGTPRQAVGLDSHPIVAAWPGLSLPLDGARLCRPGAPGLGLPLVELPAP